MHCCYVHTFVSARLSFLSSYCSTKVIDETKKVSVQYLEVLENYHTS